MLAWLRPDLPASYPFAVGQAPCTAKLDQNEAAIDLPAELKRELAAALAARPWHRYVQPAEYAAAKRGAARALGVDPDWLAITVGADQALEAGFLLAGGPGRRARWFEPTYPYLATAARRTFTLADAIALGPDVDRAIDPAVIERGARADLTVLVAPNNPTGGLPSAAAVAAALADPARLLLLDEAYADFAGASRIAELAAHPNLLIARSLSKSMLAGVHVGFALAQPDAIRAIERLFTAPYHLDAWQLLCAERVADLAPHLARIVAEVAVERARVAAALAARGLRTWPSRANFILFAVGAEAATWHQALAGRGVRVRDVGALPGLAGMLRVTIGRPDDNDRFLAALPA